MFALRYVRIFAVLAILIAFAPGTVAFASVQSVTIGFELISDPNQGSNVSAQLFVDVYGTTDGAAFSAAGANVAANSIFFLIRNVGLVNSSITDVYFDDGTLLAISTITNYDGVNFSIGAKPGNLPDGNNIDPPFETTSDYFSADSNPQTQPNGVNPGERLGIHFTLLPGMTWSDTVAALVPDPLDGEIHLRVGLKVQGLPQGQSNAYVNIPPEPPEEEEPPGSAVPEAASLAVWSLMLCCGGLATRRER